MVRRVLGAAALCCLAAGCGEDEGEGQAPMTVALPFAATVGGEAADCTATYTGLGRSGSEAQLADARIFVSQVALRDAAGAWVPVELDETDWQHAGVALLDFEDGTGACDESGTPETNLTVHGQVPAGDYDAVRFEVGVPFELNHVDSATAPSPFNIPGVFWTWQGGYKFLRVDWKITGGAVPRWNVHLGSTACVADARTSAPAAPCGRPNRTVIEIADFALDADTIQMDLAALVADADLAANTADTPPGCMSSPGEPDDCGPVFDALGLGFADGLCAGGCAAQAVFAVQE